MWSFLKNVMWSFLKNVMWSFLKNVMWSFLNNVMWFFLNNVMWSFLKNVMVVLFECCVHIIDLHPMEYAFWTGVKCSYPYPSGLYNSGSGGLYNSYLWSVYLMSGGMLYSEFHC